MGRSSIDELLQHAELRLFEGNLLIARQLELIDEMRAKRESTLQADALLQILEKIMIEWQKHKDDLLAQRSSSMKRAS